MKKMILCIGKDFWLFLTRLYCMTMFWGIPFFITTSLAALIVYILGLFGISQAAKDLTTKILLSVLTIVPTGFYCICAKEDNKRLNSDLGFVAWALTTAYAWLLL